MSASEVPAAPVLAEVSKAAAGCSGHPQDLRGAISDPSLPAGQLRIAFKRAMVAVRRLRGRETHRPGQLSYAQYGLLFGLAGARPLSAGALAEQADLTPATVTQMLEHLEAAGLVRRTRSEQDRRVVLCELTARGADVVAERHAQMEPRWQAVLAEFSERELMAAARVLTRLADYFDADLYDGAAD